MTENEIIEALCFDFANDLRERIKYVKLCWKGDLDGDDDGLFWHFSRLSVLRHMLVDQQLWLSDLSHSNDEDEIVYGLRRAACVVREVSSRWECKERAKIVRTLAARTIKTFTNEFHVYAFCLSDERDTVQHWNEYGGGLRTIPSPDDPAVAIGFIGEALFHPLALSPVDSSIFLINAVSGVKAVDHLLPILDDKSTENPRICR